MDQNKEEIDIFYVLNAFLKKLKGFFRECFKAYDFIIKKWVLLLILILVGVGGGYFLNTLKNDVKEAEILLKANFKSADYVYSVIESLNAKITEKRETKKKFFKEEGIPTVFAEMGEMTIEPVINLRDLVEGYEPNEPTYDGILRYVEFEFEEDGEITQISETFTGQYRYHKLKIVVTDSTKNSVVDTLVSYINNSEYLTDYKNEYQKTLSDGIENNKATIKQINDVIATYNRNESLPTNSNEIYVVDKNFSVAQLLATKYELEKEIEAFRMKAVELDQVVVNMNHPTLYKKERSLLENNMVIIPLILVFAFLGIAFIRYTFRSLRNFSNQDS
ncbi:hypothetical protein POV27_13525 [Aureisphaera galaxeae]|uniref:hypothetical protein n=1 Tax=Aureisphaera galaxeae TaxID=1538023 RepID=UPI002350B8A2|nr:hypothetical protein [Aureisphaera galaxeae]MDC8005077.1 hypothetical protein [Aureisphaera galaxeae]